MLTLERFHHIEWAVRKAGHRDTIEWSEAIASVQDADGFAQAAIYVICNSGMRVTVAAPIAERCIVQLRNGQSATSVFGHPGKSEAIDLIWRDRADLFAAFEAADDKIAFCQTLPWIGPVTKFHLAKNLGIDAAKPDVHLDRLAKRENVNGNNGEPVLSPDGSTVAFIHLDAKPTDEGGTSLNLLWLADGASGERWQLVGPSLNDDPKLNFASFSRPIFSLDGGFVYVSAEAWATSAAVHQVTVETGHERFVIDGFAVGLIRTGPYRGHLLVQRHKYYTGKRTGSYDSVDVIRPDGQTVLTVPGSARDSGQMSINIWLAENGWQAW